MKISIRAIEKYLPKQQIKSETLDQIAKGRIGRIEKNTGVQFRHHISGQESVCSMGAAVLQSALSKAKMSVSEIDLLIFSGASFDYPTPHNSVIIKSKIADDKINFPCLDVDSTCLSFLNALDIAHVYLAARRYKRIAIVCSEVSSKLLTPDDEKVFGLFGDAAVAIILESTEKGGYTPQYANFVNYPSGAMLANLPIGGVMNRGITSDPTDTGYYFKMDGKSLIRLTIKHLDSFVKNIEENVRHKIDEFDRIIPHQTSKFGSEYFINHFSLNPEKVIETLAMYGNCISASIPLGLEHFYNSHQHIENKNILLIGSGAGLSLGTLVLQFD
ncbi:MAG: ketoacyl-ACP synthase III [Runella slithyformis]|nr:MAG: ketoacyl-ACP synthase III [Runella slithyformis]